MKTHWLSSKSMTVAVEVNDAGIIVEAAPTVHKFIGQPLQNLFNWMQKQRGFIHDEIRER